MSLLLQETLLLKIHKTSTTETYKNTHMPDFKQGKDVESQTSPTNMTANENGDDNICPPETTISQIEEQLVRDDITNELYMPLPSTIAQKRKKKMLYVPLDFEISLTIDAFVDSGAYLSAFAQAGMDRNNKQQAPANIFKIDDPPNFQIQVANG